MCGDCFLGGRRCSGHGTMNGSIDASNLLEHLAESLSSVAMSLAVDKRLDAAADSFEPNPTAASNPLTFRRELARFVQHLASSGLVPAKRLTESAAFGEATDLLAAVYFTNGDIALEEAEADVRGGKPDALHRLLMRALGGEMESRTVAITGGVEALHRVLTAILEEAKRRRRSEYCEWIITRTIGPLDWNQLCRLADGIRTVYGEALPNNMAHWPAGRLAIHLRSLLNVHLGAIQDEGQFMRRPRSL